MTTELPTNFSEELRYSGYDLTPDSLIIDCGFYKGEFTMEMARRYDCSIHAYEPIDSFFEEGLKLVKSNPKIWLRNMAVGANNKVLNFKIKGGLTGQFNGEGESENVSCHSIWSILRDRGCDLLKLNVEGSEFEILEAMTSLDYEIPVWFKIKPFGILLCKNIQVQFHQVVPNFQERYEAIRAGLLKTHHLTFDFPWCWENYRRNE